METIDYYKNVIKKNKITIRNVKTLLKEGHISGTNASDHTEIANCNIIWAKKHIKIIEDRIVCPICDSDLTYAVDMFYDISTVKKAHAEVHKKEDNRYLYTLLEKTTDKKLKKEYQKFKNNENKLIDWIKND